MVKLESQAMLFGGEGSLATLLEGILGKLGRGKILLPFGYGVIRVDLYVSPFYLVGQVSCAHAKV